MGLFYVAGVSGAGKSTIAEALVSRGYETHDADNELCSWYNLKTGTKVEYPRDAAKRPPNWQTEHVFNMSRERVAELAKRSATKPIIIFGVAPNDLELAREYFDVVICLVIDEATMIKRVTNRTNNRYGQSPDQLAIMRKWHRPTIEKYKHYGATMIDASQPLTTVVGEILTSIENNRGNE